jgi:D-glycero-alpha-D-manno-heptose-7-phosphate kinase
VRVSILGGGSDYPKYFRENGGVCFNTTINKYIYVSVRKLLPYFEHKHRIVYSNIELVRKIDEINHPSVRECLRYMDIKDGLEIHYDGDLPSKSGIGSSSSFTVGLLNALHHYKNEEISKLDLAKEAIHVEQDLIGEYVGVQDQNCASFGGVNLMEFKYNETAITNKSLNDSHVQQLQECLMLVFTGFPHNASDIAKTYEFRNAELQEMKALTYDAWNIMNGGCVLEIGRLLKEAWEIKKKLSNKITTPYINYIYEKVLKAGAISGKCLGAGGGGFFLIFCEPDKQDNVKKELDGLLFVDFKFEDKGSQIIINNGD